VSSTEQESLLVLIADDHAATRDDVRRVLEEDGYFTCTEARDATEAVQRAVRERPDVCLLDIRMPGSGLAAAWEINARLPQTKIVMLTVSEADADLFAALQAGAVGYLVKTMNFARLPHALRGLAQGEAPIQRTLVARIATRIRSSSPRRRQLVTCDEFATRLTSREWQVLELLSQDLSTAGIAQRLTLSRSAVRVHIAAIVRKLGVENRAAAIAMFSRRSEV
jgi:DNA-binding NarL/FixJ family response regulator